MVLAVPSVNLLTAQIDSVGSPEALQGGSPGAGVSLDGRWPCAACGALFEPSVMQRWSKKCGLRGHRFVCSPACRARVLMVHDPEMKHEDNCRQCGKMFVLNKDQKSCRRRNPTYRVFCSHACCGRYYQASKRR